MRLHLQQLGDHRCLIDASRALAADIEFLQCDDVSTGSGNDISDPVRIQLAVGADTAMHVVGQDLEFRVSGSAEKLRMRS
jgi:hypothetical protein